MCFTQGVSGGTSIGGIALVKIKLSLTRAIPPIEVPPDTPWVKHIKIQSEMPTRFWGHPMYIGAIVLLPKGYDEHPNARYPAIRTEPFQSSAALRILDRGPVHSS